MKVLVVGAGIGGLTAARALATAGHDVALWERAPRFEAVGAGIVLSANAIAVLRALGVDPVGAGRTLDAMDIADDRGRRLSRIDLAAVRDDVGPVVAFHRPALHEALAHALPADVDVRHGVAVRGVEDDGDGVVVTTEAASSRWDLVIGADGLRSATRGSLHPQARLQHSGETCWRTIVPYDGPSDAVEAWGAGGHRFGVVPLTDGRAYLFLVSPEAEGVPTPPWPELERRFGRFAGAPAVAWQGVTAEGLIHHDLVELERPWWGTPRVWLIGDAAHGMTPNLGQGAGMAIEDVAALRLALQPDLTAAHAAWVARRAARVTTMMVRSRRMGRVGRLASPALRWARDAVTRIAPSGPGLYRTIVGPGLELADALRR